MPWDLLHFCTSLVIASLDELGSWMPKK